MSGTREKILHTLLNHPRSTISDLAKAAKINAISVRHHLSILQASDLITSEEERHGVGRPRLVYSLSEKGLEQFPTNYLKLTNHLLEQMQDVIPDSMRKKVFERVAERIANEYHERVRDLPIEKRISLITNLLKEQGFMLEWSKTQEGYEIREITCPYHHVGRGHPEICAIDQSILTRLLEVPVNRVSSIMGGDNRCTFVFSAEGKRRG